MTDPVQAKSVKLDAFRTARRYSWPPLPPHDFTVTSVTTALKHGLPAPHLVGWAAKKTAECAICDHDIIGAMLAKGDKKAALQHVKGSRYRDMNAKADRGNIVHSAIDQYLTGKPMSAEEMEDKVKDLPKTMWHSTAGMISGVMEFLWDSEIEVYNNESTVYSKKHGYAGTPDIVGRLQIGGGYHNAIIDIKTSPSIYDEVALQLVAYARADFVGQNDGTEKPLVPNGDAIDYGIVIRPKADGSYERADFTLSDDLFKMFLHILGVAEGSESDVLARARRPTVQ